MMPKTYKLLEQCIQTGTTLGISRAYKHTDTPSKELLQEQITHAIMCEIFEWFDFGENDEDQN